MYTIYNLLLTLTFLLFLPYFLWKGLRTGRYFQTFLERMGRLPEALSTNGQRSIWVHAVSVGEVLAVRPLVQALRNRFPGRPLVLSTTTLTGNAVARKSAAGLDGLFYAPFDWPGPVRRALTRLNPALLVLVETELWPNLIHEARRRGTRVALVNGRISPRSYPRYHRIRGLFRRVLADVDLFLMQGAANAERIRALGAPPERVRALGNLKFDSLQTPRASDGLARIVLGGHERQVWVAGSTAAGEEEVVLLAYSRVRERLAARLDLGLVVAPRHPQRFDQVQSLIEAAGFRCVRRSATDLGSAALEGAEVLLLDTLGELAQVYPLATIVFVGGSLVPAGGHNILEAAVAAKAILVGPHMENFQEIADEFLAARALVQVASAEQLAREVEGLLLDEDRRERLGERARQLVDRNRGALGDTVDALAELVA